MRARFPRRRPSPATVISAAALFISLGGAGYAATGGTFILGHANSAANTSALASAVSTGPTLNVTNNGGKPAAKFTANAGVEPFAVSNGTKVGNLNADKLDGVDSSQLLQGNGKTYSLAVDIHRSQFFSTTEYVPSPAVAPGFFNVEYVCPGLNNSSQPSLSWENISTVDLNLFFRGDSFPADSGYAFMDAPQPPGISKAGVFPDPGGDLTTATIQGSPGGEVTQASMEVSTVVRPEVCHFQVQALITKG